MRGDYRKFFCGGTFLIWLTFCGLAGDSAAGVSGNEPRGRALGELLGLSKEEVLLKASEAELEKDWRFATFCFDVYLSMDGTSDVAQRVREELEGIRWRSKVLITMPDYVEGQAKGLAHARLLYDLGLWEDAVRAAVQHLSRYPQQGQNYFLAAASLLKTGRFEETKECLARGWVGYSEREKNLALQMMVEVDREERKSKTLRQISGWVRESKFREADAACQGLVEEYPGDAQIRQSAIRVALLAHNYPEALRLVELPLRLPNGEVREMRAEVREKLTADLKKLMAGAEADRTRKGADSVVNQKSSGSSKASPSSQASKGGGKKPASMAQDFLNRIRK